MKKSVLRYGLYAGLAMLILSLIHVFILMPPNITWETAEVVGYLTMVLSMIFVFLGIRHFRDRVNGGILTFGQGLKVGLLIVLIPAICFGLFNVLYTAAKPEWKNEYYSYHEQKMRETTPPEQINAELEKLSKSRELFDNPMMEFLFMAGTVLVIGLIVTIISSLALRRAARNKGIASHAGRI